MFVRNAWYVAAWDDEVGRAPFARTILGEPIVMYRKKDGGIAALDDPDVTAACSLCSAPTTNAASLKKS